MKFVDKVKIYVQSGKGGDGTTAFRREAYVPKGGPAGGDGGKGGSVVFEATTSLSTLLDLRYNREYKAKAGQNGMPKRMHGADAPDLVIKVPVGTVIYNDDTGAIMADLSHNGMKVPIAKGGRGGRGNARFATSRNPAPKFHENGEPGEQYNLRLELKLLADVGLVGLPSVGKSTLLSVVSRAKPEIADYPFTTIVPNLGVVQVKDGRTFVMADLPGLIEGASLGKGLGHQFLRHIERCRVIVHIVDMSGQEGRDPYEDYVAINKELSEYKYRLAERPQIVVASKMDFPESEALLEEFRKKVGEDVKVYPMIAPIHEGLDPILYAIADALDETQPFDLVEEEENAILYTFEEEDQNPFEIEIVEPGVFQLGGAKIERVLQMSSLGTEEGINRFARRMRSMGVDDALRAAGAKDGDTVRILDFEFEFAD